MNQDAIHVEAPGIWTSRYEGLSLGSGIPIRLRLRLRVRVTQYVKTVFETPPEDPTAVPHEFGSWYRPGTYSSKYITWKPSCQAQSGQCVCDSHNDKANHWTDEVSEDHTP